MRQQLLGQYAMLADKAEAVGREANEDVRVLARLWQLQTKMESVGQTAAGGYGARIGRVASARENIEGRCASVGRPRVPRGCSPCYQVTERCAIIRVLVVL